MPAAPSARALCAHGGALRQRHADLRRPQTAGGAALPGRGGAVADARRARRHVAPRVRPEHGCTRRVVAAAAPVPLERSTSLAPTMRPRCCCVSSVDGHGESGGRRALLLQGGLSTVAAQDTMYIHRDLVEMALPAPSLPDAPAAVGLEGSSDWPSYHFDASMVIVPEVRVNSTLSRSSTRRCSTAAAAAARTSSTASDALGLRRGARRVCAARLGGRAARVRGTRRVGRWQLLVVA